MTDRPNVPGASPATGTGAPGGPWQPAEPLRYAGEALRLNGIDLPAAEIARTAAEFERASEIAAPLLTFELPDGLDQAGIFRP